MAEGGRQIDELGARLFRIASDAEASLVQRTAGALAQGLDSPTWVGDKYDQISRLRQGWERDVAYWERDGGEAIARAVGDAGDAGRGRAMAELRGAMAITAIRDELPGAEAVLALARESAGIVTSTKDGILRAVEDVYRRTVESVAGRVLLGAETRRETAQATFNRLLEHGVTGFRDKSGRQWELASYTEMATRTAAQRAMTQAHTESLQAAGVGLVIISDASQECELCRPWEGKVLSIDGSGATTLHLPSATNPDKTVRVDVAGGLSEARSAGLFHPNCRHSASAYLPGLTRSPPADATQDPEGDADRQRLRALERRLRRAKLREAAALDPAASKRASSDVRAAQAAIREHVANSSAKRQPAREQIGRAR